MKNTDTRGQIKQIALSMFIEKGYEASTIRDMMKTLGITAASFYYHFRNKDELYLSLLDECSENYIKALKSSMEKTKGEETKSRLCDLFKAKLDYFFQHREAFMFVVRNHLFPVKRLEEKTKTILNRWGDVYIRELSLILMEGYKKGKIRNIGIDELLLSFYRFAVGYIFQVIDFEKGCREEDIIEAFEIYWNGIGVVM